MGGAAPAIVLEPVHRITGLALEPYGAAYPGKSLRPALTEAALPISGAWLAAPVTERMRYWTPTDSADAADEGIAFSFRNRLMAEEARWREKPAFYCRQCSGRERRAIEGPHRLPLA